VPAVLFQAEIVPFRLANMKLAGALFTRKDEPLLRTWPVGSLEPSCCCRYAYRQRVLVTIEPVTE
jgi:hypothetical protein